MKLSWPGLGKAAAPSTQLSTLDSSFGNSSSQDSRWASTGYSGYSRWQPGDSPDDARWRRQLGASRRWAIWGALLGALLGLVVFAPAQWLAAAVQSATGGRLLLAEARGTVWRGSAVPVLTGGPGSRDAAAPPGRLHWSITPDLHGLSLEAQQPCCLLKPLRLHLQPGLGGYTLRLAGSRSPGADAAGAALGQWPTAWLSGLGTPWNTLRLGGSLHLATSGVTWNARGGQLRMDGALTVDLRDVSSRLSPLPVLGSFRLVAQGQGQAGAGGSLKLESADGPLRLNGNGQWQGAKVTFRGEAEAGAGQEAALANLLNIIGRRQGARSVISIG